MVPAAAITPPEPQRGTSISLTGAESLKIYLTVTVMFRFHPKALILSYTHGRQNSKMAPKIPCPMVYTHLLPVFQSDTVLGVKGFFRCN